jgi:hypothetical protein
LGGFTNDDATRSLALNATPYLARAEVHQMIPLGGTAETADRTPLSLLTEIPARHFDLYLDKFSIVVFSITMQPPVTATCNL